MSQTDYWNKQKEEIEYSQNRLPYEDFTQELNKVYNRKLEIIEEILIDLAPEADDPQYTETTSWKYENELKELDEKQEKLEPIIQDLVEKKEHEDLLKDLGWTQEQYDEHNRQLAEDRKKRRAKRK
jgi:thioester reductase-like protein